MNKRVWQMAARLAFGAGAVLAAQVARADEFIGLVYPERELALA